MKKILSIPNLAILLSCLSWLVLYYGGLYALGDPKPIDPNDPDDRIRFEKQIQKKDIVVRTALILSAVFAIVPYFLALNRWQSAKIRFSISMVISSIYLGSTMYYFLIT